MKCINQFLFSLNLCLGLLFTCIACVDPPPYFYAEKITGASFKIFDDSVGIFPSSKVLQDPNNPFAQFGLDTETKWEIEAQGDAVAGFYAWATFLVLQPTGEHQFYTALNLKAIYERSLLTDDQETEKERLLNLCIRAFQSVLDHFPRSVTYDRTGKIPYGLATLAIQELQSLGASPQGGWNLVTQENGELVAIQSLEVEVIENDSEIENEEDSP